MLKLVEEGITVQILSNSEDFWATEPLVCQLNFYLLWWQHYPGKSAYHSRDCRRKEAKDESGLLGHDRTKKLGEKDESSIVLLIELKSRIRNAKLALKDPPKDMKVRTCQD